MTNGLNSVSRCISIVKPSRKPDPEQAARDALHDHFHAVIRRWHSIYGYDKGEDYCSLYWRLQQKRNLDRYNRPAEV